MDLRFADDIVNFAKSYDLIGHVLDMLVVDCVPNVGKTKKLTTRSQHPAKLASPGGMVAGDFGTKQCTHVVGLYDSNKLILSDKSVSVAQRLTYFDGMATPVACFANGHHEIYK